jgi:hypothetical protein
MLLDFVKLRYGGGGRNRTGVHGFAGRCMTTLPPRHYCAAEWPRCTVAVREDNKLKRENGLFTEALLLNNSPANESIFPVTGAGNEARTRDPNLGKVVLYH